MRGVTLGGTFLVCPGWRGMALGEPFWGTLRGENRGCLSRAPWVEIGGPRGTFLGYRSAPGCLSVVLWVRRGQPRGCLSGVEVQPWGCPGGGGNQGGPVWREADSGVPFWGAPCPAVRWRPGCPMCRGQQGVPGSPRHRWLTLDGEVSWRFPCPGWSLSPSQRPVLQRWVLPGCSHPGDPRCPLGHTHMVAGGCRVSLGAGGTASG